MKIVKTLGTHQEDLKEDPALKEFVATTKDDIVEEIMSFNEILDHIQNQNDQDPIECILKRITSHEGPLTLKKHDYNVSLNNVTIEWENGDINSEPFSATSACDLATCALHEKENNFLENTG